MRSPVGGAVALLIAGLAALILSGVFVRRIGDRVGYLIVYDLLHLKVGRLSELGAGDSVFVAGRVVGPVELLFAARRKCVIKVLCDHLCRG